MATGSLPVPRFDYNNFLSSMIFCRFVHKSHLLFTGLFALALAGFMTGNVESGSDRSAGNDDHAAILRSLDAETLEPGGVYGRTRTGGRWGSDAKCQLR